MPTTKMLSSGRGAKTSVRVKIPDLGDGFAGSQS
jgi:hypothetical protein